MSGRRLVLLVSFAATLADWQTPQAPTPVFRARTDVVSINAAVFRDRKPVAGLTAADFTITDNGVVQEIDQVSTEALPVDVSLVIDVSGSTDNSLRQYKADVPLIAAALGAGDRLRLISFGTDVREISPLQRPDPQMSLSALQTSGLTALNDALAAVLIPPVPIDRRSLAVVFTDGVDSFSITSSSVLMDLARRSDTVVHLVLTESDHSTASIRMGSPLAQKVSREDFDKLLQIAEITGGRRDWPGLMGGSIIRAFRQVLDDFRSSYVLRYHPKGVATSGWHDVVVKITRRGQFTVRARKGYAS
jgi:VWFA-related protein